MKRKQPQERRCSYVVVLDRPAASEEELRSLASHLSTVALQDCDVVVVDRAPHSELERHARTLRWVARHAAVRAEHVLPGGEIDVVRAAMDLAACEKIIVATEDCRYTPEAIEQVARLLDFHEVVGPQDCFDPLPWWAAIDAGRVLVHRGIEPRPDQGSTFGFRRSAVRRLGGEALAGTPDHPVRRLAARGAEVFPASDVFVPCRPQPLERWLEGRPRIAGNDFALPVKTAFFFALIPLLLLLGLAGDARLAGGYAGVLAFSAVVLALRGRSGASRFFPLHACLFAPLWMLERSLSVYWALAGKLREEASPTAVPQQAEGGRAQRVG